MITDEIRDKLFTLQDKKYRDFQSKLIPTIAIDNVIGVRTPDLRKYAKELSKREDIKDFLNVYSCVDYFNVGGKTKEVFTRVCDELNVLPNEVLHIGDSKRMDFDNAKKAGVNAILYNGNIDELKEELNKYLGV